MQGELDELEREEFFRLKKVQDKKQRNAKVSGRRCVCFSCVSAARLAHTRPFHHIVQLSSLGGIMTTARSQGALLVAPP